MPETCIAAAPAVTANEQLTLALTPGLLDLSTLDIHTLAEMLTLAPTLQAISEHQQLFLSEQPQLSQQLTLQQTVLPQQATSCSQLQAEHTYVCF